MDINQRLGAELSVAPKQVEAAVKLIDDGNYMKILKYWGDKDGAISKPEINTHGTNE